MDKITKPVIIMMVLAVAAMAALFTFGAEDVREQASAIASKDAPATPVANSAEPQQQQPTAATPEELPEEDLDISSFGEPVIELEGGPEDNAAKNTEQAAEEAGMAADAANDSTEEPGQAAEEESLGQ